MKKRYLVAYFGDTPACVEAKEFGKGAERSTKDGGALHLSRGKKSELTEDEYSYLKAERTDLKLRLISERAVKPEGKTESAEDSAQKDGEPKQEDESKSTEQPAKKSKAQKAADKKAKAKKAKEAKAAKKAAKKKK